MCLQNGTHFIILTPFGIGGIGLGLRYGGQKKRQDVSTKIVVVGRICGVLIVNNNRYLVWSVHTNRHTFFMLLPF